MRKEIDYMEMAVMNTAGEEQEVCMNILNALERKRKLNKIKDAILKTITKIAVVMVIIGACLADSEDITIPVMLMGAGGLWLALMVYANT